MDSQNKKMINNTIMLYLLTFAKLILPLLTFPYLTRIFSVSNYGLITYVKSCTNYFQLVIDFGFLLSATKEITLLVDKNKISKLCSDVTLAKILLSILCIIVYIFLIISVPVLRSNIIFSILSIVPIILNVFLFDYYFRGIEKMQIVTIRFIIAKLISVFLTFIFIKGNQDIILIPIFDIITNLGAVISTVLYLRKDEIKIVFTSLNDAFCEIKKSFVFFASDIAGTAFTLINTFLIGIFLNQQDVAYWGVAYTLISAVQSMYNPISNGIYPSMIKTKSISLIRKVLIIFMPITIIGCICCYILSPYIIELVSGNQYMNSVPIFRNLLFVLLFGFPAIILGWPTLGAINKNIYVTKSTIYASVIHVFTLILLVFSNNFNLLSVALTRSFTELCLFIFRFFYFYKFKYDFNK